MTDKKKKLPKVDQPEPEVTVPKCRDCGSVPMACKKPGNCTFETLRK